MKPIIDMSVEEMKAEIRKLQDERYDKSVPYAFISYSHLDADLVYSKVLAWMRAGYNIYIDLDFENHASSSHWVDLMRQAIKNRNCVQMIAFRSINHAFSYASFMELQFSRSKEVIKFLQLSGRAPMDIDIINVGDLPAQPWDDLDKEVRDAYKKRYDKLYQKMGNCFCEKNPIERNLMERLLNEWNDVSEFDGENMSIMKQLDDSYQNGADGFYSMIYNLANMWLQEHDLIGNYKDINSDMSKRLERVKLADFEEIETEESAEEESVAAESKAAEVKAEKSAPKTEKAMPKQEKPAPKNEKSERAKSTAKLMSSVIAGPAGAVVAAVLEKNGQKKETVEGTYPRYYVYRRSRETYDCCVKQSGENEYFIMAGTKMALEHADYCQDKKLREEIIASGAVEERDGKYVFIRDYAVKGLSKAGNAITGKSTNANDFWKESELPEGYTDSEFASDGAIKNIVSRILDEYVIAKEEELAGHPLGEYFRNDIPGELYAAGIADEESYLIKGSVGKGRWAAVPWVCIFDRRITSSATKGVYVVYLLSQDCQTLYLTLNQGCTDVFNAGGKKAAVKFLRENAQKIISEIDARGFETDENVQLGIGLKPVTELYQTGAIFYKAYRKGAVPEESELRSDLAKMMDIYREYAEKFVK